MNWSFAELLLHEDEPLPENVCSELEGIFAQLAEGAPLQYLLGGCDFCGVRLSLTPATLIPRPETAELVKLVVKEVQHNAQSSFKILDVGTGSGCIAIALAKMLEPQREKALAAVEVYGCDISEETLAVAKRNAEANNVPVTLFAMDILDEKSWNETLSRLNSSKVISEVTKNASETETIATTKKEASALAKDGASAEREAGAETEAVKFDLIVSNPPYVRESEKSEIARRVLDYEPHTALFVPDSDPLLFYRAICRFGREHLREGGTLWFEINEALGSESRSLIEEEGYRNVLIHKDINDKDRFISATMAPTERLESAIKRMATLCSRKEYCEAEIKSRLAHLELSEEEMERVIARLKELDFLNEERYAEAYAKDKFRFNGWGATKIAVMLRAKGLSDETISHAVALIDKSEYSEKCLSLMRSKRKSITDSDKRIVAMKLIRFAAGRGFDYETARLAANKILKEK